MTEKIIIAGAGGQGIMLLGKVLAQAALFAGKHVTWLPSYGAEVRGGAAFCMVIISDEGIGSPYIDCADSMIIMNQPSLVKFKGCVKKNGACLINSSLVHESFDGRGKCAWHPFTEAALALKSTKIANIIALGAYIAQVKLLEPAVVLKAIESFGKGLSRGIVEQNIQAFNAGLQMATKGKNHGTSTVCAQPHR